MSDITETDAVPRELSAGDVLAGRFRLERPLGRGGFGDVWCASELLPDGSIVREVALKLMSPENASADWAREAKVLATLRHPSLVTIFSAGILELEPPTPFVAMELLEGRTLADLAAERGPLPFRRALFFAREIAAALDAIHAQGIIHLDLKPSNLLFGPDGVLRVLDFGIARQRAQKASAAPIPLPTTKREDADLGTGALLDREPPSTSRTSSQNRAVMVIGTPGFMAPEVLEGREATAAADAYALGACLFQLLTGQLPQRARPIPTRGSDPSEAPAWRAEIRASTVGGDLRNIEDLAPRTPPAVRSLLTKLLALDPSTRPAPTKLCEEVERAWTRPYGTPDPPYRGLSAYGREAEGFLFGREGDSERLATELAKRPLLVLQGASGSGKSSLALAGIVPSLAKRFTDEMDDWVSAAVRPGQDIDQAVRKARESAGKAHVGVVLVVDQLEELVTQLDEKQRARFVLALGRHTASTPGLRVVCTLREDFTTRVSALGSLGEILEDGIRFVPPPSAAAVRDIVIGPAALAGVTVDDEKPVVEDVLKELRSGEGRLPLVSFALTEWWRTREGNQLKKEAWRQIGGVAGALSRHADATLAALPETARSAARDVCLTLVTPDGTRARIPEATLRDRSPMHALALDAFLEARLVAIDDAGSASLSHEALVVAWAALALWIEEERADRVEAASLDALAKVFRVAPAEDRHEVLLRGARLARAVELGKDRPDLAASSGDLVLASTRRARRDSLLKNAGFLILVLAAAAGVGAFYFQTERHADDLREREQNLRKLKSDGEEAQRNAQRLAETAAQRGSEATSLRNDVKSCRETIVRIEQEHRAEVAKRYPADSFEAKVVTFLLAWEHVWNLHDPDRLASFFAPEVQWPGVDGDREVLVKMIASAWQKSPSNRMLLGEVNVESHDAGVTTLRITREERTGGTQNLSVLQVTVLGDKPEAFRLSKATIEKVIVSGKSLGCQ